MQNDSNVARLVQLDTAVLVDSDVLIWHLRGLPAATAMEHASTLLTSNVKHFSSIAGLMIERFDPLV